jgi:hypothetical protein
VSPHPTLRVKKSTVRNNYRTTVLKIKYNQSLIILYSITNSKTHRQFYLLVRYSSDRNFMEGLNIEYKEMIQVNIYG